MPATTSENLAFPGRNRDTEDTPITNDPANEGFPARVQSGELVFIVRTERDGLKKVLVDADGNKYLDDGVAGYLKPYSEETVSDDDVDPDVEPTASDEDAAQAGAAAEAGASQEPPAAAEPNAASQRARRGPPHQAGLLRGPHPIILAVLQRP